MTLRVASGKVGICSVSASEKNYGRKKYRLRKSNTDESWMVITTNSRERLSGERRDDDERISEIVFKGYGVWMAPALAHSQRSASWSVDLPYPTRRRLYWFSPARNTRRKVNSSSSSFLNPTLPPLCEACGRVPAPRRGYCSASFPVESAPA